MATDDSSGDGDGDMDGSGDGVLVTARGPDDAVIAVEGTPHEVLFFP